MNNKKVKNYSTWKIAEYQEKKIEDNIKGKIEDIHAGFTPEKIYVNYIYSIQRLLRKKN